MKSFTYAVKLMMLTMVSLVFFVTQAYAQGMVEIGTGTSSYNREPIYLYYPYSFGTVIYQGSDLGLDEPQLLTKLGWHVASCTGSPFSAANQRIWMTTTDATTLTATWPDPENNGWTLVKDYFTVTWVAQEWVEIQLDNAFMYDGSSNVVIYWENHKADGLYQSGYPYYYYTSTSSSCIYGYGTAWPVPYNYLSSYKANIRIYYEPIPPGTMAGTVTDGVTGFPVAGAKVTVGNYYGITLNDGSYTFDLPALFYDMGMCEKAGYATEYAYNLGIPPNGTLTQDFTISEDAIPPSGVYAEIRQIDLDVVDIS